MPFRSSWGAKTFSSGAPLAGALVGLALLLSAGPWFALAWADGGAFLRHLSPQRGSPWVVTVVLDPRNAGPQDQSQLLERLSLAGVRTVLWTTVYRQNAASFFAKPWPPFRGDLFFPTSATGPLPPLVVQPDKDGRIRSLSPFSSRRGEPVLTAPYQALLAYLALDHPGATSSARFPGGFLGNWDLPVDHLGRVWLGFSGPTWTEARYYPSATILGVSPQSLDWANLISELRDTLVVVTEPDAELSRGQTPREQDLPLVELNRIFLSDALSGQLLRPWEPPIGVIGVGWLVLTLGCCLRKLRYPLVVAGGVTGIALVVWLATSLAGWLFDPTPWVLWGGGVGGALVLTRALERRREHRQVRDLWMQEQVWGLLGRQSSQLAHNLKGLTSLVLQLNRQIRQRSSNEPVERWTELQEKGLKAIQDLLTGTSGFLQGEHWSPGDPVRLSPLLQSLWALYESGAPGLGTLSLPGEEVLTSVSPSEFLQVVDNLLKNAIEAVPPDRSVCLHLALGQTEEGIWVSLRDNGKGFPVGARLGQSSKSGGTGSGLTFVDQVVRRWGATWQIEPQGPEGTTVSIFRIPPLGPGSRGA